MCQSGRARAGCAGATLCGCGCHASWVPRHVSATLRGCHTARVPQGATLRRCDAAQVRCCAGAMPWMATRGWRRFRHRFRNPPIAPRGGELHGGAATANVWASLRRREYWCGIRDLSFQAHFFESDVAQSSSVHSAIPSRLGPRANRGAGGRVHRRPCVDRFASGPLFRSGGDVSKGGHADCPFAPDVSPFAAAVGFCTAGVSSFA